MPKFDFALPHVKAISKPLSLMLVSLAGLLQAISFALPWSEEPSAFLQIFSMAIFIAALADLRDYRKGAILGFVFAMFWLGGTCWWLFIALHQYGNLSSFSSIGILLCMDAVLSSYYGAVIGLFIFLRKGTSSQQFLFRSILFAALWTLGELIRGTLFTGFPWGAIGYAQVDGLGKVLASWIGVYGTGAIAAFFAALLADTFKLSKYGAILFVITLSFISKIPTLEWSASTGEIRVGLLQGNVPQNEKFNLNTGIPSSLKWYSEEIKANPSDIVITPETGIPIFLDQLPIHYLHDLSVRSGIRLSNKTILLGAPIRDGFNRYTNSMLAINANGEIFHRYNKNHLVPFGEYFPRTLAVFANILQIPLSDFTKGGNYQGIISTHNQRLSIDICYENLFGEELGRYFLKPESSPTILVNASNIGWFGNTLVIAEHLQIARMRALEFARPVISATNTGATAIIDHQGKVIDKLPPFTRGVLNGVVVGRGLQKEGGWGITPYSIWVSRFGLWPIWLAILMIIIVASIRLKMIDSKDQ